jgi:hypothetical protein
MLAITGISNSDGGGLEAVRAMVETGIPETSSRFNSTTDHSGI